MLKTHSISSKSQTIPRRLYLIALFLDLLALGANQLAVCSSTFANAYSHSVYRVLSRSIGSMMGLVPFSVVELLLYATILFVVFDFFKQLCRAVRAGAEYLYPAPAGQPRADGVSQAFPAQAGAHPKHLFLTITRPLLHFLGHIFLILSAILVLYIFLCGINYHRTSFSQEAGLSVTIDEHGSVYDEDDLIALCSYLVTEINDTESQLDVPYIGQTMETPKASVNWLWNAGRTGQHAMEKLGKRYRRLSSHYPFPKPILNTWILSVQQTTGVYSPFTVEANYNRDIAYYDIPFTICHELSHLRGYMQEEEANFIGVLATIGSDDLYFNYSGYVSAWVYAGNALARIDSTTFATLYSQINERTRQDMLYNNAYWKQFEGKPAEAHEQLNDVYLKIQGQTTGVRSYGHVTDLMLEYFAKNGTLK